MTPEKILIIIPTYNEKDNIGLLIPVIEKTVPGIHILVVDDGSPDGTSAFVKDMGKQRSNLFVLDRSKKEGLGKAYVAGFHWALSRGYEYIFEMDADFSHDPKYLPDFLKAMDRSDIVIGSRYLSGVNVINWPMSRLLLSYCASIVARIITGIPLRDCTAGFKCFRRAVLEKVKIDKIDSSGYAFQIEMNYFAWKNKFRITEIPIVFTDRQRGASKMSTKIIREGIILLWKLRLQSIFYRTP
ncbi:MAG: polyprenol monophosphomannose synthase [Chitinivibrionales bacterium]